MVRVFLLAGAVAAVASVADAHTAMVVPKPSYPAGFYQGMNPVMRIDSSKFANGFAGHEGLKRAAAAMKGQSSLKSFIMSNAVLTGTGSATKECGWALANGEPQPLPAAVDFPWGHPGPCEVWCDNTKVLYNDDCMGNGVGKVSLAGKCNGAKMIQAMYIGTHVENWEVYMQCAPIGSGGGGGAAAGGSAAAGGNNGGNAGGNAAAGGNNGGNAAAGGNNGGNNNNAGGNNQNNAGGNNNNNNNGGNNNNNGGNNNNGANNGGSNGANNQNNRNNNGGNNNNNGSNNNNNNGGNNNNNNNNGGNNNNNNNANRNNNGGNNNGNNNNGSNNNNNNNGNRNNNGGNNGQNNGGNYRSFDFDTLGKRQLRSA